jgi:hypothetical protein
MFFKTNLAKLLATSVILCSGEIRGNSDRQTAFSHGVSGFPLGAAANRIAAAPDDEEEEE